jgi:hypothetical protein
VNEVYIPWKKIRDRDPDWNEICAKVVERFGIPGDRYTSHPAEDWMIFEFKDEQDSLMCKMLLSEYVEERNTWTLTVDENGVIVFPKDLLAKTGWQEGDVLDWANNNNGSSTLTKKAV